jgi:hypothetical protein
MLTAHALSEESLTKSAKSGAAYFVPKDKMADIDVYVADVFTALEKKQSPWERWYRRLGGSFDKRFHGTHWRKEEEEFWKDLINTPF